MKKLSMNHLEWFTGKRIWWEIKTFFQYMPVLLELVMWLFVGGVMIWTMSNMKVTKHDPDTKEVISQVHSVVEDVPEAPYTIELPTDEEIESGSVFKAAPTTEEAQHAYEVFRKNNPDRFGE